MTERTDFRVARLPPRRPAGPALTATGSTARTRHRRAIASIRTSSSSTPTPWRSAGRCGCTPRTSATCSATAEKDLSFSTADSAAFTPKSVVADPAFSWGDDHRPRRRWNRTVVYECHVKGMTARHPAVPPEHRGTFLGLASEPVIDHLLELGVTAVELMPVQQAAQRRPPRQHGADRSTGATTPSPSSPPTSASPRSRAPDLASSRRW